jgi:hypothetical protein
MRTRNLDQPNKTIRRLGLLGGLAVFLVVGAASAQDARIVSRPLTPKEISDYALPAATQTSGGLFNVGLGAPVYLEAQVPAGTVVNNTVWALVGKPAASASALAADPLGAGVPIYNPGDRSVYAVAGRSVLVPDKVGSYTVNVTVSTSSGDILLSRNVTGAEYIGVGKAELEFHDPPQCARCHSDKFSGWQGTKHATGMTRKIDGVGVSHFTASCLKCHNTGFDAATSAVNGGFDDVANVVGWIFPNTLAPGNWDAMPADLKAISNVQCESCHGPGDQHARSGGNPIHITVSTSSGDCAQCHDSPPYHTKNTQWNLSRHAVTTRYPTGENRSACVGCHSGLGFIDRIDGKPASQQRTDYEAIVCATCHDPHDATNPHQLRKIAGVTLMDGTVVAEGGKGRLCMNCHISRQDADNYVASSSGSSRFGPHHGPQTDMLKGANAIEYGRTIPSSAHLNAVPDSCVTCHMQATPANGSPGHNMAGEHTFKATFDSGTPNDDSDDVHLVAACNSCHGGITTFDFARQDFDGDGTIEGVQTEVKGLLDRLGRLLPPFNDPAVNIVSSFTKQQLKAAFNYMFVLEDKSYGIHNTSYAVNILKASIADLTGDGSIMGDEDNDCLPDTWELTHFGSLTAQNKDGDADGDGLSNAMELAAGTNPTLSDSDNDGFSDFKELHTGTNPLDAASNPQLGQSMIYHAAELLFHTESGKTYQIQRIAELGTPQAWESVGPQVVGSGQMIQQFISTRVTDKYFYRVVEVQP